MNVNCCKAPFSGSTSSSNFSFECKCCSQNQTLANECIIQDFPITRFMRFLKHLKLHLLLKKITDRRASTKIKYSHECLLLWALSVFFFRAGSLNELQTSFDRVPLHKRQALWNFFKLPEGSSLPSRQTVTDMIALVSSDEINALLIQLFKWSLKSKLFYNHQHALGLDFGIACDGFVVHHYTHPHAVNEQGENNCPYCLPRTRNKGTSEEKTYWIHTFVNLAIILPGGVQLPLYVKALKSEQLKKLEIASDEEIKQECEFQAAKEILPQIRKEFSRLSFILQCDSLYANEPLIKLCRDLAIDFLIVRQEKSLKSLAKHCDALEKTEIYQSYQSHKTITLSNWKKITRTLKWFNGERVGDQEVHVIRFLEIVYDSSGLQEKCYKTEWLSSKKVTKHNCFSLTETARRRADHEDLHNTLKNRGFNAKHDYARSNANAAVVWKLLMFVAFWIFELFSCTTLAQEAKGGSSWRSFAKNLLIDLLREPWEILSCAPVLQKERVQFRFNFAEH